MLVFHQHPFLSVWVFCCYILGLFQLEGAGIQLIVLTLQGDQLFVATALNDTAMLENHDSIGVLDRGEAVGDDEHRPAGHQGIHASLDNGLGTGIDGRGGLV